MLQLVLELRKLRNDGLALSLDGGVGGFGGGTVDVVNALGLCLISLVDRLRHVVEQVTSMTGQRSRAEG
jgi:hypothetical protein